MDKKQFFKPMGQSVFMGRPYKINKILFGIFSLIVILGVFWVWSSAKHFAYVECNPEARNQCINVLYNSPTCEKTLKNDEKVYNQVCTEKYIPINVDNAGNVKNWIGEKPPIYIEYYTLFILGGFLIILVINTLLHNRHLFKPRSNDEVVMKDFFYNFTVDENGQPIEEVKNDANISKVQESSGQGSNLEVCPDNNSEREDFGDKSEVESGSESSAKEVSSSNGKKSRLRTERRLREGGVINSDEKQDVAK